MKWTIQRTWGTTIYGNPCIYIYIYTCGYTKSNWCVIWFLATLQNSCGLPNVGCTSNAWLHSLSDDWCGLMWLLPSWELNYLVVGRERGATGIHVVLMGRAGRYELHFPIIYGPFFASPIWTEFWTPEKMWYIPCVDDIEIDTDIVINGILYHL